MFEISQNANRTCGAICCWRQAIVAFVLTLVTGLGVAATAVHGADPDDAWDQFRTGHYTNALAMAEEAIRNDRYQEDWRLVRAKTLLTLGRYAEARSAITNALEQYSTSIRLRLLGREVYLSNGQTDEAESMLRQINLLIRTRPWAYRDPVNRLAFGRTLLLLGADPRLILEQVYDSAKREDPDLREAYLASGELSLDKHDFELAAKVYREGLKRFPDDPDFHYGLARAYAPSEQIQMQGELAAALNQNTNHVPSLLLMVDHLIDAEEYAGATKVLDRIREVNPWHPDAWAYQAVIEHLENHPDKEQAARETALRFWKTNPRVEYLIGLKLSQKYRFAEGAAHQRQALAFDADYLPAKAQLAQDLLRLGDEAEGWAMAEKVHDEDGYDVTAYNLVTLRETMQKFQTVTNRDFIVRMKGDEADIYGQRALALLDQAKSNLCAKYGLEIKQPTVVEIFPDPKDFGVRTFGMPDNPGYLGVCFGRVITANSPASPSAHAANWQAVLWHEFCHVVTLQLTRNKMPRWLSEGISVYEESQTNPTWGQRMTPRYREMVLDDGLTPIADLSSAFLAPPTPEHLQFGVLRIVAGGGVFGKAFRPGATESHIARPGGRHRNQSRHRGTHRTHGHTGKRLRRVCPGTRQSTGAGARLGKAPDGATRPRPRERGISSKRTDCPTTRCTRSRGIGHVGQCSSHKLLCFDASRADVGCRQAMAGSQSTARNPHQAMSGLPWPRQRVRDAGPDPSGTERNQSRTSGTEATRRP